MFVINKIKPFLSKVKFIYLLFYVGQQFYIVSFGARVGLLRLLHTYIQFISHYESVLFRIEYEIFLLEIYY